MVFELCEIDTSIFWRNFRLAEVALRADRFQRIREANREDQWVSKHIRGPSRAAARGCRASTRGLERMGDWLVRYLEGASLTEVAFSLVGRPLRVSRVNVSSAQ